MINLVIAVRPVGNVAVVDVRGTVDSTSAPQLEAALKKELDAGSMHLVVDLRAADYVSSAGWACLLTTHGKLASRGGAVVVCAANAAIKGSYTMLGLDDRLRMLENVEAALATFKAGANLGGVHPT